MKKNLQIQLYTKVFAALLLSALLVLTGCSNMTAGPRPNDTGGTAPEVPMITIHIRTLYDHEEAHVTVIKYELSVPKGSVWKDIAAQANACVKYDDDWVPGCWYADRDNLTILSNSYTKPFAENTAIFVFANKLAPFVSEGVSLILSADKKDINIKVKTSDGTAVKVEGCSQADLQSDTPTVLHASGTQVNLIGNITELDCSDNKLTAFNIYGCPTLQKLNCSKNSFAELHCERNKLTSLDIQNCTVLQSLDCSGNKLTSLNVQGCSVLQNLSCSWNELTSLDVQSCSVLQSLGCSGNALTSLDVQSCTVLQSLYCLSNKLTSLDVHGLAELRYLYCRYNELASLNVRDCSKLHTLMTESNKLTSLDVRGCSKLYLLYCRNNELTSLNVQGCSKLHSLMADDNKLTSLDVRSCTNLYWLDCDNNELASLNIQGCSKLSVLHCYKNQLTSLNVQGCTDLSYLSCSNNRLTSLNVQGCTDLSSLSCHNNRLTSLNVHDCPGLKSLRCYANKLGAAAFTDIFNALPVRTENDMTGYDTGCYLYTEASHAAEENCRDFSTPDTLKDAFDKAKNEKHWKMYKFVNNGEKEEI